MSIRDEWEMQCPHCGDDEHLYIEALVPMEVRLCEDGTDDNGEGDREWDEMSGASCHKCNWHGTVADMKKAYREKNKEAVVLGDRLAVTIHSDWYGDGVESGEDLWRLDLDDNETQIQLFAKVEEEEADELVYTGKCRIFLEVDRRDPATDNEKQTFYTSNGWEISAASAGEFLSKPKNDMADLLAQQIAALKAMPCNEDMVREHYR